MNMLIYEGTRYKITTDGAEAVKTDGRSTRTMRFFPERDAANIAGEIDELSAWRLLHDIAVQAERCKTPISPEHILIDGDGFILSEWSESEDFRFRAPEGYSPVWALGATAFYVFLGCYPFQGRGGAGQSPKAPIPIVRRELPELSSLIVRCLDYRPQSRPSLQEIADEASKNMTRCRSQIPAQPPLKQHSDQSVSHDELERLWPDEM